MVPFTASASIKNVALIFSEGEREHICDPCPGHCTDAEGEEPHSDDSIEGNIIIPKNKITLINFVLPHYRIC